MKVKLVNGKPSEFEMSEDEVQLIVVEHVNKLLQQKFDLSTKVRVDSVRFQCGYDGLDGFEGDITTKPDTPVLSEVEL
jgi:hypothetical protein